MAELEISQEKILAAIQSPAVRAALAQKATGVRGAAEALANSEDVEADFWVEEGTRPKGRPYARVLCDNADQELGTSKTARRRLLGRAAEANR